MVAKNKSYFNASAGLLLSVLLVGCGGGDTNPSPPNAGAPPVSPSPSPTPPPVGGTGEFAGLADQTVTVGQHALFYVDVEGATAFQWRKNGQDIAGATQAQYLTGKASASDDGTKYSVRVTTPSGTKASQEVSLKIWQDETGAPPADFWGDVAALPAARNVMTFSFVNRSNGKYADSELFWNLKGRLANGKDIDLLKSFAEAPTYDMSEVYSARMYFYLAKDRAEAKTGDDRYFDFIEMHIARNDDGGTYRFNGNSTRVDAFGLKTALRLRCDGGTDVARGEDYGTFLEDREVTFRKYLAESDPEFAQTANKFRPYRIVEPGAAGFSEEGPYASYFRSYVDRVWQNNGINEAIVPKPKPFLRFASNQYPDLEAAVARHVADKPGTFTATGKLINANFWQETPDTAFYSEGPANFYARYWHEHGIAGKAYGFPYDDVGGYSSFIACDAPRQLVVAIGW